MERTPNSSCQAPKGQFLQTCMRSLDHESDTSGQSIRKWISFSWNGSRDWSLNGIGSLWDNSSRRRYLPIHRFGRCGYALHAAQMSIFWAFDPVGIFIVIRLL